MADFPSAPAAPDGISAFANSLVDANRNNGGYDLGLGESRLSRRLLEHYKRLGGKGGKIRCGDNEKFYLDTESAGAVDRFGRELEGRGYSDIGELIDWTLRLAVRPTAKTSAASITNYALQSFFINVSDHGRSDTLPQQLVGEGIQVAFEFLVDVLSVEIKGIDAEDALREGFEAFANARRSGISKELLEQVDNYFDLAVDAIRKAAEQGKIGGGKITIDGIEALSREFGEALAKKLKKASPERKQKMIEDPTEVFKFYNELLRESGQTFTLEEDESLKHLEAQKEHLVRLKAANDALKKENAKLTAAGNSADASLKNTRGATKQTGMAI